MKRSCPRGRLALLLACYEKKTVAASPFLEENLHFVQALCRRYCKSAGTNFYTSVSLPEKEAVIVLNLRSHVLAKGEWELLRQAEPRLHRIRFCDGFERTVCLYVKFFK